MTGLGIYGIVLGKALFVVICGDMHFRNSALLDAVTFSYEEQPRGWDEILLRVDVVFFFMDGVTSIDVAGARWLREFRVKVALFGVDFEVLSASERAKHALDQL